VHAIHGGDVCTVTESERFFSYRRDGITGRMATLIWLVGEGDSVGDGV
jgi:copper oxidase (laccase) domain-containing protein